MLQHHELSQWEKTRRGFYFIIRDTLERALIEYTLVESYANFMREAQAYPYVERRELKPGAVTRKQEYASQNPCLVLFYEGTLDTSMKKYFRFRERNRVSLKNLKEYLVDIELPEDLETSMKYVENADFTKFFHSLLPLDYALLIQHDPLAKKRIRYLVSHFHVKIDGLLDQMVENMAKRLRYINRDLYEKGEDYAEALERKFFEYYSFHHSAGGRRSAAIVAAELFHTLEFCGTVYVGSAEARSLTRISPEEGIAKFVLLELSEEEIEGIIRKTGSSREEFCRDFLIAQTRRGGVVIFQVRYQHTEHALPPKDGTFHETLNIKERWITVSSQSLIPVPHVIDRRPIAYPTIYRDLPLSDM
ncbi:MAG: hypothetical protein D6736_19520 [Nitrospinota bacterium]|nr:MAG: hypothetical protein D6736_19520 [Nitrospinota bacterium]